MNTFFVKENQNENPRKTLPIKGGGIVKSDCCSFVNTFLDGQVETVLSLSSALTEARALSYSIALTEVRALCCCRCRPLLPRQELFSIQLLLPRYEHCVVVVVVSYCVTNSVVFFFSIGGRNK